MGFSIEALVGGSNSGVRDSKSSPSPSEDMGRGLSPPRGAQGPVAPVPTFPAVSSAAFLDTLCGGRAAMYPHHQHEHPGGYAGIPAGACNPHVAPFFLGRESYPLYPWLLARHPRFLAHRLP
ncbi:uncharacterized protein LOC129234082, partial [Uloborus diversus]|uniref:uncharacterized protein LOC129234082 n=1 Tax=Uloborus diversus TaxID=327109 RepID=UPI002409A730